MMHIATTSSYGLRPSRNRQGSDVDPERKHGTRFNLAEISLQDSNPVLLPTDVFSRGVNRLQSSFSVLVVADSGQQGFFLLGIFIWSSAFSFRLGGCPIRFFIFACIPSLESSHLFVAAYMLDNVTYLAAFRGSTSIEHPQLQAITRLPWALH